MVLMDVFERYYAYILARGEAQEGSVKIFGPVWILPTVVAGIIALAFHLEGMAKWIVVLPAGVISLAGIAFVGLVYMRGFIRTDRHKADLREAVAIARQYPHLMSAEYMAHYPRPEGDRPEALALALSRTTSCTGQTESEKASGALMYAIGNDHRGDYRPVVLLLLPVLSDLLNSPNQWTQFAVVDALCNLWFSHHPEPGFETFQTPGTDAAASVESQVRLAIGDMLPAIDDVAHRKGPAAAYALELATSLRNRED